MLTNQEIGQGAIRSIDYLSNSEWGNAELLRAKNMKYMYEKSADNPTLTASFRGFLTTQKESFETELQTQQTKTREKLEEDRQLNAAAELARLEAMAAAEEAEQNRVLELVKEEEDDGAFSNASEAKDYQNLNASEEDVSQTRHINQRELEEEFKNEKDSEDYTIDNIPVSSHHDSAVDSGNEEHKASSQPIMSDLVKEMPVKRQTTMLNFDGFADGALDLDDHKHGQEEDRKSYRGTK